MRETRIPEARIEGRRCGEGRELRNFVELRGRRLREREGDGASIERGTAQLKEAHPRLSAPNPPAPPKPEGVPADDH